jgi:hypothetical protein
MSPIYRILKTFPLVNQAFKEADWLCKEWTEAKERSKAMKFSSKSVKSASLLGVSASLLLVATLLPAANALELSLSSAVEVEATPLSLVEPQTVAGLFGDEELSATASGAIFSSQIALVSAVSRTVELARTPLGAKKVAKSILIDEYGFAEKEYKCLNQLWTQESNWNYKSRNKQSGAHGIPQALPASKMNVVSTDWRTNPVTQIRWGLRYISIRYETPCKAWAKHKRSNWY